MTQFELFSKLLASYKNCVRQKPHIKKTLFHLHHETEIYHLASDIYYKRYVPSCSTVFVVTFPKPREIIAANIRDRVVHHFIYDYTSPYWGRRFAPQSYACRVGKGPLKASLDLRDFIRSHQRSGGRELYFLKLDVQNFFPSIDLEILRDLIFKKLQFPLYKYLRDVRIFHRPTAKGNYILASDPCLWRFIPSYKSLFNASPTKGLAICNLTSQFFANIYLNHIDQFVVHQLNGSVLYWSRYVDDFLFFTENPETLKTIRDELSKFLEQELRLLFNPKKSILQALGKGVDFLGYWHKPDHTLMRQKNIEVWN